MADLRQQSYNAIHKVYENVYAKVKELQGDKGYVDTQDKSCDTIYFYGYVDTISYTLVEGVVCGVRATENGVEILGHTKQNVWDYKLYEDDFKEAAKNYDNDDCIDDWEWCWQPIIGNETILYIPTLFAIAEVIEEYEDER